ncbi:nucleotidyltransferase family protein [Nitratireductor indicus]|uniref:nucleotidyltransferase family protein n=1 Tax=Nitratireductor indicus TaxID=721133 RepID=UPI00287503E5|nr:nucleotidyltransferase family protein [Nitratireductor indicus]MDS1137008.1 nucleotidyltransferase family protein [Nitratireductor indicus]
MSTSMPQKAMVLAAGLGKRMRPITETLPKPLVRVAGRTLIDWALDTLEKAGVGTAIVNVHYLADQMEAHLKSRQKPHVVISDERDGLMDSAGGVIKALPKLGAAPFFIVNADTFWLDRGTPNLERLALAWDGETMDILLMVADFEQATGHSGSVDFLMDADGRLTRAKKGDTGVIYAGAIILDPRIFAGAGSGPQSLNAYFDAAASKGRLFGMKMGGDWITVGTPDAIAPAEVVVAQRREKHVAQRRETDVAQRRETGVAGRRGQDEAG